MPPDFDTTPLPATGDPRPPRPRLYAPAGRQYHEGLGRKSAPQPEPDPAPDTHPMTSPTFTWTSDSRSDPGKVRRTNEDSLVDRPDIGLWAVADGMGGHAAGDVASSMIAEALDAVPSHADLTTFVDDVEDRVETVNRRLREVAAGHAIETVGSTVAALLAHGSHCVCIWAGDSRIYRYRAGGVERLTQDHALVEELVEKGVLSREEAAAHPQANLVTRAVGATDALFLDLEVYKLEDDDLFILCSDGLDKELTEVDIAATVSARGSASVSDALVETALARGARDNVTVVAVKVDRTGADDDGNSDGPA